MLWDASFRSKERCEGLIFPGHKKAVLHIEGAFFVVCKIAIVLFLLI